MRLSLTVGRGAFGIGGVAGFVPGGLAPDADRWVPCKPGFFLSVRVLPRRFWRRFIEELENARRHGQLKFFGEHTDLADTDAFIDWLMPLRQCERVVYAKRPILSSRKRARLSVALHPPGSDLRRSTVPR